jgi:hypothetical protein
MDDPDAWEFQLLGLDGPNKEDVITVEDTWIGWAEAGEDVRLMIGPADAKLLLTSVNHLPDLLKTLELSEQRILDLYKIAAPLLTYGNGQHRMADQDDAMQAIRKVLNDVKKGLTQ